LSLSYSTKDLWLYIHTIAKKQRRWNLIISSFNLNTLTGWDPHHPSPYKWLSIFADLVVEDNQNTCLKLHLYLCLRNDNIYQVLSSLNSLKVWESISLYLDMMIHLLIQCAYHLKIVWNYCFYDNADLVNWSRNYDIHVPKWNSSSGLTQYFLPCVYRCLYCPSPRS
jgi:hypothetical protein